MMTVSRREFIRDTAASLSVAGGIAVAPLLAAESAAAIHTLPRRTLGRTRERVSILGFGVAPLGSDNTTPEEAARIVNAAIDAGITYLDVSPDYGDIHSKYGNAEMKLKEVLKRRRHEVFLVTKVNPDRQDREGVVQQVHESLERMGTDHVDAVHIHNLGDFDMERLFRPDGALAGLKEARTQGLLRFIGTSGHMRPPRFVQAIETGDIDLTMNALNFADRHTYDFEGLVLPAAKRHGTAVVAMKVLGGAKDWKYDGKSQATLAAYHERAIRYALGLPGVACAVLGLSNEDEIHRAAAVVRAYKPLSEHEKAALLAEGRKLAEARGLYYGPTTG